MAETITQQMLILVGGYFVVFLMTVFALNFSTRGLIFTWMRVKMSRGARLLMKCRTPTRDYYTSAKLTENVLIFKVKGNKEKKTLPLQPDVIYQCFGVSTVDYDEQKGAFARTDFSAVSGHDPEKTTNLITRALMKPSQQAVNVGIITLIVVILIFIGVGYIAIRMGKIEETLKVIQSMVTPKV